MKQIIYKLDKLHKKIILLVFVHLINLLNQSGFWINYLKIFSKGPKLIEPSAFFREVAFMVKVTW
jgi:hypothetical protein